MKRITSDLRTRVTIVCLLLVPAGVGQWWLFQHIREARAPVAGAPSRSIVALPFQLGEWHGRERVVDDPRVLYGDEHLSREYVHPQSRQRLLVWIAYSKHGKDRSHHPEICMAVAGQPEDEASRKALPLPGHEAPVQQFRFGRPGSSQWVYYWYYTLPSADAKDRTWLQQLYHRFRYRPASLTIEVFAAHAPDGDQRGAQDFVGLLDRALQPLIGREAKRGSKRLPVTRLDI